MSNLTIQDWLAIYAAVVSTGAILWNCVNLWKNRERLEISVHVGYEQNREQFSDGYHDRWFMAVSIRNRSPSDIRLHHWGIDRTTTNGGPIAIEQTGMANQLGPYEETNFALPDPSIFMLNLKTIYVEDAKGRRWKAKQSDLKRVVKEAEQAIEANKKRSNANLPSWVQRENQTQSVGLFQEIPKSQLHR